MESLALAEVIAYMEDANMGGMSPTVFRLSELTKMYASHLPNQKQQGSQSENRIHSTRFKERLLANCPNLPAVSHGRDVLLNFKDNVGIALHQALNHSDSDAMHLMHTVKLLRNEIFSKTCSFNGSLAEHSKAVSPALLTFVTMLLEGPGNVELVDNEAAASVSQLILFNAVKRRRPTMFTDRSASQASNVVRHSLDRSLHC